MSGGSLLGRRYRTFPTGEIASKKGSGEGTIQDLHRSRTALLLRETQFCTVLQGQMEPVWWLWPIPTSGERRRVTTPQNKIRHYKVRDMYAEQERNE